MKGHRAGRARPPDTGVETLLSRLNDDPAQVAAELAAAAAHLAASYGPACTATDLLVAEHTLCPAGLVDILAEARHPVTAHQRSCLYCSLRLAAVLGVEGAVALRTRLDRIRRVAQAAPASSSAHRFARHLLGIVEDPSADRQIADVTEAHETAPSARGPTPGSPLILTGRPDERLSVMVTRWLHGGLSLVLGQPGLVAAEPLPVLLGDPGRAAPHFLAELRRHGRPVCRLVVSCPPGQPDELLLVIISLRRSPLGVELRDGQGGLRLAVRLGPEGQVRTLLQPDETYRLILRGPRGPLGEWPIHLPEIAS